MGSDDVEAPPKPVPPSTSHSSPGSSLLAQPPPPGSSAIPGADRFTVDRRTDCSVVCRWRTPYISKKKSKGVGVYSPYFGVREGVDCRVVVYPNGNSKDRSGSLLLQLEVVGPRSSKFDCFVYYKFSILNHLDDSKSLHPHQSCRFTAKTTWSYMCDLPSVLDPKLGFLSADSSFTITADVRILNESISFTPDNSESKSASSGPGLEIYSGKFTWTVKDFSLFKEAIKTRKLESPCFPAGKCDLLISVYQSVVDKVEYLSLCLESKKMDKVDYLPLCLDSKKMNVNFSSHFDKSKDSESCWCLFKISVLNKKSGSMSIHKDGHRRFANTEGNGSGSFFNLVEVSIFFGPENGYLVDDTAVFIVSFEAIRESYWCGVIPRSPVASNPVLPKKRDWYKEGFSWKIENFSRLKDVLKKRKITGLAVKSKVFRIGRQDFRLVVYPRGNSQLPNHLSLFLEVIDKPKEDTFFEWSCLVSYRLSVVNQKTRDKSVCKDSIDRFSNTTKDMGWSEFMSVNSLLDKDSGFLVGDTISFLAEILLIQEIYITDKAQLRKAGFRVDLSGEGVFFLWLMHNFSSFKDILETKKIASRTFQVGGCELQIGLCKSMDSIFAFVESHPSVMNDPDKNFWVSYSISLMHQKNPTKSVGVKSSFFTKSTSNSGIQILNISDFMDPGAGYLVQDSILFGCQILDHCPWFDFSDPGVSASDDSQNLLPNDPDELSHAKCSEVSRELSHSSCSEVISENEDDICHSMIPGAGIDIDISLGGCSQHIVTSRIGMDIDWICSTMNKLCVYLGETITTKEFVSEVKNLVNSDIMRGPCQMNWWTLIKTSQQGIIDLLLDIVVECCNHQETSSSVNCNDTSSAPASLANGVLSRTGSSRKNGLENSCESSITEILASCFDGSSDVRAVECLDNRRPDISEEAVLEPRRLEQLAKSLLKITSVTSVQDLNIKWPEQSKELLAMIINSLEALDVTLPQGFSKPKQWPVSVQKISHVLGIAPKNLQLDLVMLVPKLLDHSEHPLAAQALIHHLMQVDGGPELQGQVSASDDSQNLLPNDPDELSHAKCSEVSRELSHSSCSEVISENEDDICHSMIPGAGIDIDISLGGCSQHIVTSRIGMDIDWICSTMNKLCVYLGETITTKEFVSEVKNLVNSDIMRGPCQMNWWTLIKTSQQGIIDLLLDIVVECCNHQETSSSVNCNDTSSAPASLANGVLSRTGSSRKNGLENSCESSITEILASCFDGSSDVRAVECLDNRRPDISEEAVLEPRRLEQLAKSLLKITSVTSVQDLNIKWPEQSKELLAMIINSLEALDVTLPQGFSKPKQWPVSVQKISHVLGIAPKNLQLDLVMLVPKLLDHSEHPLAAQALIHHLMQVDGGPELQGQVFDAINQLDFSSEVWEHLFFLTSKLVLGLCDGALTSCLAFLIKTASHCHHISRAVRVIRAKLCSLGIEVSPCVLNFLRDTISKFGDIAEALLRDIDVSFELEEMCLARSGGSSLFKEDELSSTRLNETHVELLHEARHFSDVYILVELLSVNSLTTEAHQVFERAVARRSIVVRSMVMVLERKWALRLNVGPISFAGNNQQSEETVDANNESSPVEQNDFASVLGLAEMLLLSRDSGVRQFAQMLYSTLFRLFGGKNYHKRMLKRLVDHAISHIENGHPEDTDLDTLLLLVNEKKGIARPVLNMMREFVKATIANCQTLRNQLRAREDHNLHIEEEKLVELADMVRQHTSLLDRLSESEDACNHYKSELKLEKDSFARERKELTTRIQEVESQLEWFQSEQNGEITTLSTEKIVFKDRVKTLETQFSQLKTQNSDDLTRLVKEKCTLAENLKIAEAARKRSAKESISYARKIRILEDDRHSLLDEICQLKATVWQLGRGKLDKGNTKQSEKYIRGMEANNSDFQGLVKEKLTLAENLENAVAARNRFEEELKSYAKMNQILEDDGHSLQDELRQLKVTVGQLEQGKLDREEKIYQREKYIVEMEAHYSACQQYINSLEVTLLNEMSQNAPTWITYH